MVGNAENETNGIQDVGFPGAIEASDGVELRVEGAHDDSRRVGLEPLKNDLVNVHLRRQAGTRTNPQKVCACRQHQAVRRTPCGVCSGPSGVYAACRRLVDYRGLRALEESQGPIAYTQATGVYKESTSCSFPVYMMYTIHLYVCCSRCVS